MARVLVTDGEQRSSLALVRSLGAAGHEVLVASWEPRPLAGASRFCTSAHRVADPGDDCLAYREGVEALIRREEVGVVIPATDPSALVLLDLRERLPEIVIPFPPGDAYARISDKRHLTETGASIGVPVPRQVVLEEPVSDLGSLAGRLDGLGEPVVVKPARSAVIAEGRVERFSVRIAESRSALASTLSQFSEAAYPILLQEHVSGPGRGLFLLADRGRTVAAFSHRRIREKPPSGGVSTLRESAPAEPRIKELAERILAHHEWTGVAMVEFKEDAATGIPYLMEVNGRFWGSLQLAVDAGVDFPRLLLDMALGQPVDRPAGYAEGVRVQWLWGDIDHWLAVARGRGPGGGAATARQRIGAMLRLILPFQPGARREVLRLEDARPFFRESRAWLGDLVG